MSRHDEHGPVERDAREHGPEWWALGAELCTCGHRLDEHPEVALSDDGATRFECQRCSCLDFALDKC